MWGLEGKERERNKRVKRKEGKDVERRGKEVGLITVDTESGRDEEVLICTHVRTYLDREFISESHNIFLNICVCRPYPCHF